MEKEFLFEILDDWNFWNKKITKLNSRELYEKELILYDKSDEITVIKGIRRCGKSSILVNHIKKLLDQGVDISQILFVNFEDPRFINNLDVSLLDDLFNTYLEYVNDSKKIYVFLDEIQEIPAWEKWIRTKYELKIIEKMYVTGSSSKLLSSEFGTALSGRYLDLEMYPLSFKEFLNFKEKKLPDKITLIRNKIMYKKLFNEYVKVGGFPKIVLSDKELQKKEIMVYYDSIILKDVVERYHLKNAGNVRKIAFYLISNIGKPLSLNSIKTSLNISYDLVENYFNYLKECYLIFDISRYDSSLKKQFSSQKKIYTIDLAFNYNVGFKFSEDIGRLLENLVFIELKRNDFEIYYHKNVKECDFLIKEGFDIVQAIQVTKSLKNIETKKREVGGLVEACLENNLNEGIIITEDEEYKFVEEGININVIPIWKWLLNEIQ